MDNVLVVSMLILFAGVAVLYPAERAWCAEMKVEGNICNYTFKPINQQEFPDTGDFAATYRRTLKIRILFNRNKPEIEDIQWETE